MGIFKRCGAAAKMVFSETAFERYLSSFAKGEGLADPFGGVSEQTALKYSAFFGCSRVLSETFASTSINEFKKVDDKGDKEKTNDTGLLPLFKFGPNDETTAYNFFECAMYQIVFGGNFVAERLTAGTKKLGGLLQLDYNSYDVFRGEEDRRIKYKVRSKKGDSVILDRSQVLHIPGPSMGGVMGMSALEYAAASIRLGTTYEEFGQSFYNNGAAPSGVFSHPRVLKPAAYDRLNEKIKNDWTGLNRVGTPILAEDGLQFDQVTIKPIDAELLSSKRFQIEDVCRFLRVPPHLVQHLEKSTFNNIEQQSLEFIMYTMLPYFKRFEQNINFQLLTPLQRSRGYFFEFNISSLLRGDQKTMSEAFYKGRNGGWLSVNDIRRMMNLNSIEGGDVYLQPLNMEDSKDGGSAPDNNSAHKDIMSKMAINEEVERIMDEKGFK